MVDLLRRNRTATPQTSPVSSRKPPRQETFYTASQWRLIWWRFRRHRLAVVGTTVLIILILMAVFADFVAPLSPTSRSTTYVLGPPMIPVFIDDEGEFHFPPIIYGVTTERNEETLRREPKLDTSVERPLHFFVEGEPYRLWGIIESNIHLFGTPDGEPLHLLGTDNLGRDIFSRTVFALRVSLSVGLAGVFISFVIGLVIGGISGYFGGWIDFFIQRLIELIMSIPTLPLWMTLAAIVPRDWNALQSYFAITILLGLLGWTGLARDIRSKLISLREEDYIVAAQLGGSSDWRIITRHMLPAFTSYIIVAISLAFPGIILGETALSFLGFGLRPPVVSLGVLLEGGQNIRTIAQSLWVLAPTIFVILIVLAFSFMGDGLRDAADPYAEQR
ncbi:MAG: ABC transporter permease [Chloroflexi bacterium]|nr:ABC transporter permease [Chloroflexota bacterium]